MKQVKNHKERRMNMYIVLDIETTGFSYAKGDAIIEVGAVKLDKKGEIIDEFSSLVNPERYIPNKIQTITGITNDMVKNSPKIGVVLSEFAKFLGDHFVIAHNANFDCRFLNFYGKNLGVNIPDAKIIDTLKISKKIYFELTNFKLKDICEHLDIPYESGHRAFADVLMTAKIFKKMLMDKEAEAEINKITSSIHTEQITLDGFQGQMKKETKETKEKHIPVISVSYWRSSDQKKERIYVNTLIGDMFLDTRSSHWVVLNGSDISSKDVIVIENEILRLLKLQNRLELLSYKGKFRNR
jgi:DNA polymerase III subunit epsilon